MWDSPLSATTLCRLPCKHRGDSPAADFSVVNDRVKNTCRVFPFSLQSSFRSVSSVKHHNSPAEKMQPHTTSDNIPHSVRRSLQPKAVQVEKKKLKGRNGRFLSFSIESLLATLHHVLQPAMFSACLVGN